MKQYCRYCAFCVNGDAYYCTAKEIVLSRRSIKNANRCTEYAYSELGDVDSGTPYLPRPHKKRNTLQYSLFERKEE